jgi:hypothetical protein
MKSTNGAGRQHAAKDGGMPTDRTRRGLEDVAHPPAARGGASTPWPNSSGLRPPFIKQPQGCDREIPNPHVSHALWHGRPARHVRLRSRHRLAVPAPPPPDRGLLSSAGPLRPRTRSSAPRGCATPSVTTGARHRTRPARVDWAGPSGPPEPIKRERPR